MAGILERVKPLGFTPLVSRIKGEVLYYNFRGIGPVVMDKSGHGNLGKLRPKDNPRRKIALRLPPEVAMVFDGENWVDVGDKAYFDIDVGSLTVFARVKPYVLDKLRQGIVTKRRKHWSGREGWDLRFRSNRPLTAICDGRNIVEIRGPQVETGALCEAAMVANGDTNTLELFVNDESVGVEDYSHLTAKDIKTNHPLRLAWFTDMLEGELYEVRIYDRALSEEEIKRL